MTLSLLYGSTLWIATSVASAQLAFPGAIERAAENLATKPAASSAAAASADSPSTTPLARSTNCPFCDGGDCIVCNQSGFRLDYDACGSHFGGPFFDEPCYASPVSSVASAPKATEPDDLPSDVSADVVVDAEADSERAGLLSTLSNAVDRAPGVVSVRETLSAGVIEATRALELARQWLANRPHVVTVDPPPARTEASEKLRDWFASSDAPELAANPAATSAVNVETTAHPAVTKRFAPPSVAEIDAFVPAEAFAPIAAVEPAEREFVDWEAQLAQAYLDGVADEQRNRDDPRQDVITPAIRTAAVALERFGHAALNLSGRLRSMADASVLR